MTAEKVRVLVVDDEKEIRALLCEGLSGLGFECYAVPGGRDALARLREDDFGIVLLDIKLPDISGMEILTALRSSCQNTAAIIMLTGISSLDVAVEAMRCGAVDFIVKPFSLDKLYDSIQKALRNTERLPAGQREGTGSLRPALRRQAGGQSYSSMDAIAIGVQARCDLESGYSKVIIRETVAIARQLGMADEVIQSWTEARLRQDLEKKKTILSSLDKLERSLPAQELLGLVRPYRWAPQNDRTQN